MLPRFNLILNRLALLRSLSWSCTTRFFSVFPSCLLLSIVTLVGCGNPKEPNTYVVRGKVVINGKPAAKVEVAFFRTVPFAKTIVPVGVTEEDGTFTLTTFTAKDGAPVGDYIVTLTWPTFRQGLKRTGPDRLHNAYSDPKKSTIRAKVESKKNELPPIELTIDNLLAPLNGNSPKTP